ncbi:methyl-accepting chemotaxis protein [Butyrivibrio sp. AE3004]|uniref:methyl-accepting chemotaxis protein n=1 Tax=Butyrivibrio sp. AE3004 TaxID=1506994 RepID=UPI00068978E9|nr:methyl-accepting chemotaxis protein [Butyrivibrio sp. AE3004]
MREKRISVRREILLLASAPAILITIAMLITGILFMRSGMESEILKGLLSSANTYKDIAVGLTDRNQGDSAIETDLKQRTGYDFTWFENDTRKNSSLGNSVIGTKAADTVISEVLNKGNTFTSTKTMVAGTEYFVAYVPVKDDSGKVSAMAFTGVSRQSVEEQITKSIIYMLLISAALLIIGVIVILKAASGISGAIIAMNDCVEHLAKGVFKKADKYLERRDEIGIALNNTNELIDKLESIVSDIRESASTVNTSSGDLSDMVNRITQTTEDVSTAVQEIAQGATQQAGEVLTAAENVGKIGEAVGNVQTSTEELDNLAAKMKEASEVSGGSLSSLQASSEEMTAKIDEISETIQRTQDAVNSISAKVEGITAIATQTNLLSLNASIEAARAGEAGRGFSVVAEEIGKLAEDSKVMADNIKKEMSVLLEDSEAAVLAADHVKQGNLDQQDALGKTIESINGMLEDIKLTVSGVATISKGAKQCATSKDVVADTMDTLSAISQQNAASSQETGASMQELSNTVLTLATEASDLKNISEKLSRDMEFFK